VNVTTDVATAKYLEELQATNEEEREKWTEIVWGLEECSTDICLDCGWRLGGLLGTFTWGIIHGQGSCHNCGFPYQYYHCFPQLDDHTVVLCAFVPLVSLPLKECSTCGGRGFLDRFDEGLTTYGPVTTPCPECAPKDGE